MASLATLRRLGRVLDIRIDLYARWRGGSLDHMLGLRHSLLAESVVSFLSNLPGWIVVPEVSFSIYGERGVIDLLAFHVPTGSLLVIELKTWLVDINELVGRLERKTRLARQIASERGWEARSVSRWVIVRRDVTNARRVAAHRSVLRAAYPDDGRMMRGWLRAPAGQLSVLSTWMAP